MLAALLLLALAAAATAEFRASVDRRVVDENDVVVLELARDAQVFVGNPDLTALEDDFRVLGTQRSSQFTIVGGRTRSLTTWTVTLQPKRRGTLRIPPIEYDGERTQPITITVTQPSPEEVQALERTVFFETEVGKRSLWVQEQVLYTVRLYYAADAVLFGDLPPPPNVSDAVVQALGDSRPDVEVRDGVRYNVIEQRYAVIPQRSGTLVIPPETFTGAVRIAERGQTRRKNIRISSDGHRVEVKPQPADWPAEAPWLPARELMLTQRWDPSPRLTAGEPATRTLELVARGIAASALPKFPETEIAGTSSYANQPVLDEGMAVGDFIASRIESTVIIPEREGPLELPEVRVPWFDVERGEI
ncbi:MAG: BatD family protein, partial [Pseudomonadales bacterium]|nr:BatD family protein [Pseudomonadales bacterium]